MAIEGNARNPFFFQVELDKFLVSCGLQTSEAQIGTRRIHGDIQQVFLALSLDHLEFSWGLDVSTGPEGEPQLDYFVRLNFKTSDGQGHMLIYCIVDRQLWDVVVEWTSHEQRELMKVFIEEHALLTIKSVKALERLLQGKEERGIVNENFENEDQAFNQIQRMAGYFVEMQGASSATAVAASA